MESIRKINYRSDFKIIWKLNDDERHLHNVPFRLTFYTSSKYEASWDGKDGFKNCKIEDDGSVVIIFSQHGLGLGELKVTREYFIADSDFADGVYNFVSTERTGIVLTNGASDDLTVETEVIPPYIYEKQENAINVTYSEVKKMRDSSLLKVCTFYRITDYVTFTVQEGTRSAGHVFDIIALAISENELSEDVKVALHEGDSYFANSNINAWEAKYCLDNDTNRFSWASINGKGVIYYLKDERSNECPYDFKNIMFSNGYYNHYTFNLRQYDGIDYSVIADSLSKCSNNIIKPYYENGTQSLNNITIITENDDDDSCVGNKFGIQCSHIKIKSLLNRCTFGSRTSHIEANALENSRFGDNVRGIKINAISGTNILVDSENLADADRPFVIDDVNFELSNVRICTGVAESRNTVNLETSYNTQTMVERGKDGQINAFSDMYGLVKELATSIDDINEDIEQLNERVEVFGRQTKYIADNSNYDNQALLVGYFGKLRSYGVKGDNIDLRTITVYARSGSVTDVQLYCKLLLRVDGSWVKVFESSAPKSLNATAGTPIEFAMERKNDVVITDKDMIAIVFHEDKNAASNSYVSTGMKTISIPGALTGAAGNLGLTPGIQSGWSPALTFAYYLGQDASASIHSDRDEEVNGRKTFNKAVGFRGPVVAENDFSAYRPINARQGLLIDGKSFITQQIDAGEFKVLHHGSSKGFIIRTVNGDQDILPLELLTTNGYASYKYGFPAKNGEVLLKTNIATRTSGLRLFINANGELDVTQ